MTVEELEQMVKRAGVREQPWELNEGDGYYSIFGRHPDEEYDEDNLPCRITTGGDFDDLESARFAVEAVNALPLLLDALRSHEGQVVEKL